VNSDGKLLCPAATNYRGLIFFLWMAIMVLIEAIILVNLFCEIINTLRGCLFAYLWAAFFSDSDSLVPDSTYVLFPPDMPD
jgi:hypothetical protein